jgi:hypothetical protein
MLDSTEMPLGIFIQAIYLIGHAKTGLSAMELGVHLPQVEALHARA